MSAFSETGMIKKLSELNSSQQSIQTLSLWLIHHRKHYSAIVKTWLREFQSVPEKKKLTFMYLANDIIQNSKKKGPEYGKEFATVLPKVFEHISETCTSEHLIASLGRTLNIWEERGVYDAKMISEFRNILNKPKKNGNHSNHTNDSHEEHRHKHKSRSHEKRRSEDHGKPKKARLSEANQIESFTPPLHEFNCGSSPYVPPGESPESEELIKALINIENSASGDVVVRERIANLPPEISEISCLQKVQDKEAAHLLAKQVNEAVELLNDYNGRLASEMEERTKLASMLHNFEAEQKELLAQAEHQLEEYKKKLSRMVVIQKEIRDHLTNLPDLKQLPDVTGGLAPLPSAGDLFNTH